MRNGTCIGEGEKGQEATDDYHLVPVVGSPSVQNGGITHRTARNPHIAYYRKALCFSSLFMLSTVGIFLVFRTDYCEQKIDPLRNHLSGSLQGLSGFFKSRHYFADNLLRTPIYENFDVEISGTPVQVSLNSTIGRLLGRADDHLIETTGFNLISHLMNITDSVEAAVKSNEIDIVCNITAFTMASSMSGFGILLAMFGYSLYVLLRDCCEQSPVCTFPR